MTVGSGGDRCLQNRLLWLRSRQGWWWRAGSWGWHSSRAGGEELTPSVEASGGAAGTVTMVMVLMMMMMMKVERSEDENVVVVEYGDRKSEKRVVGRHRSSNSSRMCRCTGRLRVVEVEGEQIQKKKKVPPCGTTQSKSTASLREPLAESPSIAMPMKTGHSPSSLREPSSPHLPPLLQLHPSSFSSTHSSSVTTTTTSAPDPCRDHAAPNFYPHHSHFHPPSISISIFTILTLIIPTTPIASSSHHPAPSVTERKKKKNPPRIPSSSDPRRSRFLARVVAHTPSSATRIHLGSTTPLPASQFWCRRTWLFMHRVTCRSRVLIKFFDFDSRGASRLYMLYLLCIEHSGNSFSLLEMKEGGERGENGSCCMACAMK